VGSGRTLSEDQARHIQQQIDDHNPEDLGIPAALWTRKAVRDLIRKECGIEMPVRTVGESLKRWDYTAKVPRRHAKGQDPEEVREWLEEAYPAIETQATAEGAEIHTGAMRPERRLTSSHTGATHAPECRR
jgi:transposase